MGLRVKKFVTIIGFAALGGAIFTNWDKLIDFGTSVRYQFSRNTATAKWQYIHSYSGDCRTRPAATVCVKYEDGYVWLTRAAVSAWQKRVEGHQTIQVAVTSSGRYEHVLGTNKRRKVK